MPTEEKRIHLANRCIRGDLVVTQLESIYGETRTFSATSDTTEVTTGLGEFGLDTFYLLTNNVTVAIPALSAGYTLQAIRIEARGTGSRVTTREHCYPRPFAPSPSCIGVSEPFQGYLRLSGAGKFFDVQTPAGHCPTNWEFDVVSPTTYSAFPDSFYDRIAAALGTTQTFQVGYKWGAGASCYGSFSLDGSQEYIGYGVGCYDTPDIVLVGDGTGSDTPPPDNKTLSRGMVADTFQGVTVAAYFANAKAGKKELWIGINRALQANRGTGAGSKEGWVYYRLAIIDGRSKLGLAFLPNGWLTVGYETFDTAGNATAVYRVNKAFGRGGATPTGTENWSAPAVCDPATAQVLSMGRGQNMTWALRM